MSRNKILSISLIGDKIPIARALPNPPSQIGRGITALTFNAQVTGLLRGDITELFFSMGDCFDIFGYISGHILS